MCTCDSVGGADVRRATSIPLLHSSPTPPRGISGPWKENNNVEFLRFTRAQEACITPRARVCHEERSGGWYISPTTRYGIARNPRFSGMHNRTLFIIRDSSRVEMLIGPFLLGYRGSKGTEGAISIYVKSSERVFRCGNKTSARLIFHTSHERFVGCSNWPHDGNHLGNIQFFEGTNIFPTCCTVHEISHITVHY